MGCYQTPSRGSSPDSEQRVVEGFKAGLDESRRCLRNDCIAAAPQEAHSAGNPMSQREKAGFNWDAPDFSISAFNVGCGTPCASNSKLICLPEASLLSAISVLLILILQPPAAAGLRQPAKVTASVNVSPL